MPEEKKKRRGRPPKAKVKTLRFTMDLTLDLHAEISEKIEETGQTMKGYFITLAKQDLKKGK